MTQSLRGAVLHASPARIAVSSFGLAILFGALVLVLPVSSREGVWTRPVDALFTSTSAVCVTGLIVKSTPNYWSPFGQLVILGLIQVGGLGIMTLGAFAAVLVQRRLPMRFETVMSDIVETEGREDVWVMVRFICVFTLIVETAGALCLYLAWRGDFASQGQCIYHSVFHSVAAFCNAGFGLRDDSLVRYAGSLGVNAVICSLIVVGGIGFVVVHDLRTAAGWWLFRRRGKQPRLATHTRLVLIVTAILLLLGFFGVLVIEWNRALRGVPLHQKFLSAIFQSVTARTAGFNTMDLSYTALAPATALLIMVLMYIGASPVSTGGGIKTTTVGIMASSIIATLKGRQKAEMFNHAISESTVHRVVSIILLSVLGLVAGVFLLLVTEDTSGPGAFQKIAFDAISAFGTVGLSQGLTGPDCAATALGKLVLCMLMFFGRLGPITLVLSVGELRDRAAYQYPEDRVLVG